MKEGKLPLNFNSSCLQLFINYLMMPSKKNYAALAH